MDNFDVFFAVISSSIFEENPQKKYLGQKAANKKALEQREA